MTRALARTARLAVAVGLLLFVAAISIGVGGFLLLGQGGEPRVDATAATLRSDTEPSATPGSAAAQLHGPDRALDAGSPQAAAVDAGVEWGVATPDAALAAGEAGRLRFRDGYLRPLDQPELRDLVQALSPFFEEPDANAVAEDAAAHDEDRDDEGRVVAASSVPEPQVAPAAPAPDLAAGHRVQATVSFYYCESGNGPYPSGDGGGFCGHMRDGSIVYPGAAACDVQYLGQQFRIDGDPTGRVYTCADTGSAVHGLHRDIWFNSSDEGWQWVAVVGHQAVIEILP